MWWIGCRRERIYRRISVPWVWVESLLNIRIVSSYFILIYVLSIDATKFETHKILLQQKHLDKLLFYVHQAYIWPKHVGLLLKFFSRHCFCAVGIFTNAQKWYYFGNFAFHEICSFFPLFEVYDVSKCKIGYQWVWDNYIYRLHTSLVLFISNGIAKTKLAILVFLYCVEFVGSFTKELHS